MNRILMLALAADAIKTGVFKSGINKGKEYSIALGRFAGPGGRIVSRIIPNVDVAKAFQGQMLGGTIVEAEVQPYTFEGTDGKPVTVTKKFVVQFDGESLATAIKAHGKKAALAIANVLVQENASADVQPA